MDIDKLVDEIMFKVKSQLDSLGKGGQEKYSEKISEDGANQTIDRPGLLLISRLYHQGCSVIPLDKQIRRFYRVDNSIDSRHEINPGRYEEVIICDLDNDSLSKLSMGIFDTPYLKIIEKSVMLGKIITIPAEEVEFLKYRKTAPCTFVQMMNSRLNIIKSWKIQICPLKELTDRLIKNCCEQGTVGGIKGKPLLKKIVTKKDLIEARRSGYTEITIKNSTILTDVACEYIREKNIKLNISQSVR